MARSDEQVIADYLVKQGIYPPERAHEVARTVEKMAEAQKLEAKPNLTLDEASYILYSLNKTAADREGAPSPNVAEWERGAIDKISAIERQTLKVMATEPQENNSYTYRRDGDGHLISEAVPRWKEMQQRNEAMHDAGEGFGYQPRVHVQTGMERLTQSEKAIAAETQKPELKLKVEAPRPVMTLKL